MTQQDQVAAEPPVKARKAFDRLPPRPLPLDATRMQQADFDARQQVYTERLAIYNARAKVCGWLFLISVSVFVGLVLKLVLG